MEEQMEFNLSEIQNLNLNFILIKLDLFFQF